MKDLQNTQLLQSISSLLDNARRKVAVAVNQTIVLTYYEIGRMIVEDGQNGEDRAEYGKAVLKDLSLHLTEKFGLSFSEDNLSNMRKFYQIYSNQQIAETLSRKSQNNLFLSKNKEILYYDRKKRLEGEKKTMGIILCQDKSEAFVRYTLPEDIEQIFASKYLTVLPSKQDFINILNSDNGKIS